MAVRRTIDELEAPRPSLDVDWDAVDTHEERYQKGRIHVQARARMPEKQLFDFAEYQAREAEHTGYSDYSYWKSVWRNFLKKKTAVVMSVVFLLLFVFTFVALAISKFDVHNLRLDNTLMFRSPDGEFWFGTDNLGRDYWCQVWYATRTSILLAVLVSVGEIALGVVMGLIWGYVRGLDSAFNRKIILSQLTRIIWFLKIKTQFLFCYRLNLVVFLSRK